MPRLRAGLGTVPGLRFWRLLGTGRGEAMTLSADLRRWALVAVWEDEDAARDFLRGPVSGRLDEGAVERWDALLRLRSVRGGWGGVAWRALPGAGPDPGPPDARAPGAGAGPAASPGLGAGPGEAGHAGPVLVLTRASIRLRRLRAFYSAIGPVETALLGAGGRLRSLGAGEWPVARQATVSIWRTPGDAEAFAYAGRPHAEVVRATRVEGWYAEELFARFSVRTLAGTWGGDDPLAVS